MTVKRWFGTLLMFVLACVSLRYAVLHVRHAGGLLLLAWCFGSGFWLLVNTVDLLCGRWIRRGTSPRVALPPVVIGSLTLVQVDVWHHGTRPARDVTPRRAHA